MAATTELIGKQTRDIFPADIADRFSQDDQKVLESGEILHDREERIVNHATGQTIWILTTKVPFRDKAGHIIGLVGIDRDITRRMEMEQRVREHDRLAAIGRITASLSHEIRNPLSAIKMNLQLLKRNSQLTENAQVHIDISVEEMMRLEGILSEVLDFAKPLYPRLSQCHINEILEDCVHLLRTKCEQKSLTILSSFDSAIPCIQADTKKLSQAFLNLVLNAFEASEEGGSLRVSSHCLLDAETPLLQVTIEDEGSGISPEDLDDLFKPFFTTKPQGTGLGLTNVKRIVDMHKGWIDVTNRKDGGASFHVNLPIT